MTDLDAVELERRIARMRRRKLMIGTPTARAPVLEYTIALAETFVELTRMAVAFDAQFVVGSSNLPKARNELCARFLASGADDLLMIDDDMGWHPSGVVRLLLSEREVVGAVGRKKVDRPTSDRDVWCFKLPAEGDALVGDDYGAIEVGGVGTAFLKISREALAALAAFPGCVKLDGHDGMKDAVRAEYRQFFQFGAGADEIGEDYEFCRRYRAAGGRVWVDPSISLKHVGVKAYEGCLADQLVKG